MKSVYDVIIRPVITEQSMEDLDIKKFAFEVAKDAVCTLLRADLSRKASDGIFSNGNRLS